MKDLKMKNKFQKDEEIVIGCYYETPQGVARTIGWCGSNGEVTYYLDDNKGNRVEQADAIRERWIIRLDLADFPNATDPMLPYVFDLFWDIKYTSELKEVLTTKRHSRYSEIYEKACELNMIDKLVV